MDIFAHGLWGGIVAKAIRRTNLAKKFNISPSPWWTGFWATFPDLFAFVPLALILTLGFIFGEVESFRWIIGGLYSMGHSFVTWVVAFLIVWIIYRRPRWELLGGFSHVLIDIFTHPADRYPTPFLWPLQETNFDGTSWATPEFMIVNYILILSSLYFLRDHKNLNEGFYTLSKPRKILLVILFLSSLTAFIR
jgi:hypothetical protein